MYMSGRSKQTLTNTPKRVWTPACCLLFLVLSFHSCRKTPEQQAAEAVQLAQKHLAEGNVDAYLGQLDFGQPLDSAQTELFAAAIRQQFQHEGHTERVTGTSVQHVQMHSDSTATAFYTLYLANGDSVCKGQAMVLKAGEWKLKMKD